MTTSVGVGAVCANRNFYSRLEIVLILLWRDPANHQQTSSHLEDPQAILTLSACTILGSLIWKASSSVLPLQIVFFLLLLCLSHARKSSLPTRAFLLRVQSPLKLRNYRIGVGWCEEIWISDEEKLVCWFTFNVKVSLGGHESRFLVGTFSSDVASELIWNLYGYGWKKLAAVRVNLVMWKKPWCEQLSTSYFTGREREKSFAADRSDFLSISIFAFSLSAKGFD